MSEHSQTFPNSALNMVPNEDGFSEAQSITLMETTIWEFPASQLHPKMSSVVISTWIKKDVQRGCLAISSGNTKFCALNLVSLGRKGKKETKKETRVSILTTLFLDLKRTNANRVHGRNLLFYILKPITYTLY